MLVTMGGGMSLVLAGVGSYYAWVTPAFNDVLEARELVETQSISQQKPKQISRQFNTARYATIGLLATGTGLTGYGADLEHATGFHDSVWSRLGWNKRTVLVY